MSQTGRLALVDLAAVTAAVWLGEHVTGPVGLGVGLLAALCLAFLTLSASWRNERRLAFLTAGITLIIFAVPWLAAAKESSLAFNECVADGERVRSALAEYRDVHHQFPARLSQLPVHLPGQLVFPPHVLKYERTQNGYTLSFSDWLVSHEASDQQAFLARK